MENNFNLISLKNNKGLEVTLCDIGASVFSLKYNNEEMLLSPKDPANFITNLHYYGKTLGRIAGRIKSEQNGFTIDNTEYDFCLHGGLTSISFKKWSYEEYETLNANCVKFSVESKDLEGGFPGNLTVTINYSLLKDSDKLIITQSAISDKDTILNLSNHMYFNFNTHDLLDYRLWIPASRIQKCHETQLPYDIMDIPSELDFRKPTRIGDKIKLMGDNTIDHTFLLDDKDSRGAKCILENDEVRLKISTSYEAFNCYLSKAPLNCTYSNPLVEVDYRGLAIEPEKNNVSKDSISLKANEEYYEYMSYEFERI